MSEDKTIDRVVEVVMVIIGKRDLVEESRRKTRKTVEKKTISQTGYYS